ncbi:MULTISPECIES: dTDP-glucose 4,6-dehydratase [Corynebacterium]|uniref:dTDP-glucose 4,6-dehydratase n=1 Tax=Corynebacterium TaxID=1716 RepID=UPI00124EE161|nr:MULTISPECIES: dTDP-glucose 4,6-dehydratase [Corynebacterium]
MHLVVTGGAGFIGANFVRRTRLTRPEVERITVLDALTYAANPDSLAGTDAQLVQGTICDEQLVDEVLHDADLLVHFAAESHNDNSIDHPEVFARTNVEGTVTLAKCAVAHGVRMHHISTDEVYGDLPLDSAERFQVDSPYRPSSPYSASKAASDHMIRAFVRSYGLQATISNCSNNYGPYQHPEKFIPRQILKLLQGESVRLYGDGRNVRDWIHVDDHNDAVWRIIDAGKIGSTYLIGADGEASNRDVAELLVEIIGGGAIEYVRDRPGHDRRYAIDPSSTEELGWAPAHTTLRAGLEETVEFYRRNPQWWQAAYARSEELYAARGV